MDIFNFCCFFSSFNARIYETFLVTHSPSDLWLAAELGLGGQVRMLVVQNIATEDAMWKNLLGKQNRPVMEIT